MELGPRAREPDLEIALLGILDGPLFRATFKELTNLAECHLSGDSRRSDVGRLVWDPKVGEYLIDGSWAQDRSNDFHLTPTLGAVLGIDTENFCK